MPNNTNILGAVWTQAYVDSLPDSSFAFVDGKTRKLPYKDKDGDNDLPHIRNALARLNQTQGIPDDKKAEIKTKLQNALKKGGTKASDMRLSTVHNIEADETTKQLPSRMMLLRSGTFNTQKYGEVTLEAADIREMADNFHKGIGMAADGKTGIPVDYSHESHKNAGAWIKQMEATDTDDGGAELWATNIEFSDSGKAAILGKEYKMLSSDFYPKTFGEWVDPESGVVAQNVIVGAAFTNRPLFTGQEPINASEVETTTDDIGNKLTVIHINASQKKESNTMDINAIRVKAAEDVTVQEQRFLQAHVAELSKPEVEKFELVATEVGDDKKPKQIKAAEVTGEEGKVVVEASELKTIVDKVSSLEASFGKTDKDAIHEKLLAHVKRGAIKADRVDSWVDRIAASDQKGREEIYADFAALADNPVLAKEQGDSESGEEGAGAGARQKLMDKATDLVNASLGTDKPISIEAAVEQVKREDKELAAQAADEGRMRVSKMTASDDQLKAAGVNVG